MTPEKAALKAALLSGRIVSEERIAGKSRHKSAMWLYQTSESKFGLDNYRLEVWENQPWRWPVKAWRGANHQAEPPQPGDIVVFYHAQVGFVGWAVVLQWTKARTGRGGTLYFRPVTPSDHLKMFPWADEEAQQIADAVRGEMAQRTLFWIEDGGIQARIARGITAWLANVQGSSGIRLTNLS
jgi:hypothetical protein